MSRSEAASVASNTRWAFEPDRTKATSAATAAFLRRFEDQVDPDRQLPEEERVKRARNLLRAHMARIRANRRRRPVPRRT